MNSTTEDKSDLNNTNKNQNNPRYGSRQFSPGQFQPGPFTSERFYTRQINSEQQFTWYSLPPDQSETKKSTTKQKVDNCKQKVENWFTQNCCLVIVIGTIVLLLIILILFLALYAWITKDIFSRPAAPEIPLAPPIFGPVISKTIFNK